MQSFPSLLYLLGKKKYEQRLQTSIFSHTIHFPEVLKDLENHLVLTHHTHTWSQLSYLLPLWIRLLCMVPSRWDMLNKKVDPLILQNSNHMDLPKGIPHLLDHISLTTRFCHFQPSFLPLSHCTTNQTSHTQPSLGDCSIKAFFSTGPPTLLAQTVPLKKRDFCCQTLK